MAAKSKTCFRTPDGIYQFKICFLGLSVPFDFSQIDGQCLGDLKCKTPVLYLDKIEIFSVTFEEHLNWAANSARRFANG